MLWEFIKKLNRDGHTIILTTHYLEEAETLCTRVGLMKQGEIVALDSTQNLLNKFAGRVFTPGYESFLLAADIVKRVGEDPGAIGFSALGFQTPETKVIAVAARPEGPFLTGTAAEVASGDYPYDRFVYLYVRRDPGHPLDPFVKEYLRLALSHEGQQIIGAEPDGFIPLNAREAAAELAKLD